MHASDYEQATFEWAWEHAVLKGLSDDEAEKLLVRIARRQMRAECQRQQTLKRDAGRVQPLGCSDVAAGTDPVQIVVRRENMAIFLARLRELSQEQQEVARMYIQEGLTVTEIAAQRGTSKASASTLLKRAMAKVREWFR